MKRGGHAGSVMMRFLVLLARLGCELCCIPLCVCVCLYLTYIYLYLLHVYFNTFNDSYMFCSVAERSV